ncbi:MAG: GAF domain-containing protein [Deltaproteobacteria bacterium]|nr:GAF domain-containing protein [Deltaproteobacteria bacterium]
MIEDPHTEREALTQILDGIPVPACVLSERRMLAANLRMAAFAGRDPDELVGGGDVLDWMAPEERLRLVQRGEARLRGEFVPEELETVALRGDGTRVAARLRIARFPPGGPQALLVLVLEERDQERAAALIRGFVDLAGAVQDARGRDDVLRIAREKLAALGFSVSLANVAEGELRFLSSEGILQHASTLLAKKHPESIPASLFPPVEHAIERQQGMLVDDLPGQLCTVIGCSRETLGLQPDLQALCASVPVDGKPAYALIAAAPRLDGSVAGAFGLLGKHLGTAIETTNRIGQLHRNNAELMAVNYVARTGLSLAGGQALAGALGRLAGTFALDGIALFRRESAVLVLAAHEGFSDAWAQRVRRSPVVPGSPWAEAALRNEPVVFDLEADGSPQDLRPLRTPPGGVPRVGRDGAPPEPQGGRAVAVPLQGQAHVEGVLVATRQSGPLTRDDLRLFSTVAAQLAISLQNALLFATMQRRLTELTFLLEVGQAVASSLQTQDALGAGVRATAKGMGVSATYAFLLDDRGLLRCAAFDDAGSAQGLDIELDPRGDSLSGLAMRTGQGHYSNDIAHDSRLAANIRQSDARTGLAVPLFSRERAIGVLLLFDRGGRKFDDDDLRLVTHVGQILAASVENAVLYAEQRRRAEEMTLLNEMSRSLAGALELEPLLETSALSLKQLVGAGRCFILLGEPKSRVLRFRAQPRELTAALANVTLSLDERNLPAQAIRERRAVQLVDAKRSELVTATLARVLDQRTVLAVPLLARDEAIGAVLLDAPEGRVFTTAEIERASAVAGQLALAVLSARLFEDLRLSYRDLERTQKELVDRERLAALGELSASIAHEVRNPLGVIFNALSSLNRFLKPEGNVGILLGIIGEEADRLNRMVGDLLDYSRPLRPALQPVQLLPLVRDAVSSARPVRDEGRPRGIDETPLEVSLEVPEALVLRADQRLLRQALVNLFLNGFQAMPKGGRLRVVAERRETPRGAEALLLIQDTGPGIPVDVRARIFQPFFTTKATGTGLGLAVVKRIIEGHGGTIGVGNRKHGAEFELWLPAE